MTNKGSKTSELFAWRQGNYGGGYEGAYYSKINGECVLGGLISKGSSWEVAQLPSTCRPEKRFDVQREQSSVHYASGYLH